MNMHDIDPNFGTEHNIERYEKLIKHADDAARQIVNASVKTVENVDDKINLVTVSFPADTEINKIAMHYIYRAAYASDKFVPACDKETGSMEFRFYMDMASPYV